MNGKLTAEQVRESIERHFGKVAVLDDGKPVEWRDDWVCKVGIDYKGIADELNAVMCGGECEITPIAPGSDMGRCSACGEIADTASNYCWKCGAKAVER